MRWDMGTEISWHSGGCSRQACQLRGKQQQRSRRPRVRRNHGPLSPLASCSPHWAEARREKRGGVFLSSDLRVALGLATCWFLSHFKDKLFLEGAASLRRQRSAFRRIGLGRGREDSDCTERIL